jgi:IS30 family transposase
VEDKSKFGHWEMDTIVGKGNKGAILTLTERTTNLLFMARLPHGKNALETAKMAVRLLLPYKDYEETLTTDNGSEFACHELITKKIGAKVPYSSWQKGAVKNINKLIRQYQKKGQRLRPI